MITPFIIGIAFFLLRSEKLLYLILALFLGGMLYFQFNPFRALYGIIERFLFSTLIRQEYLFLLIMLITGSMLYSLLESIGVTNFIKKLSSQISGTKKKWLIPCSLSTLFFIDPNFSTFISGLFSKATINRAERDEKKHAYAINTIPVALSTLIPLTTLTPVILGALNIAYSSVGMSVDLLKIFIKSIPYQFYNWLTLFFLFSYFFLDTDPLEKIKSQLRIKSLQRNNSLSIRIFEQRVVRRGEDIIPLLGLIAGMLPVISVIIVVLLLSPKGSESAIPVYILCKNPEIIASSLFIGIITTIIFIQLAQRIISRQKEISHIINNKSRIKWESVKINNRFIYTFLYIIFALSLTHMSDFIKLGNLYSSLKLQSVNPSLIPFIAFILSSILSFISGSGPLAVSTMIPFFIINLGLIPPQSAVLGKTGIATIGAVISGSVFGYTNSPISSIFLIATAASETRIESHFGDQIINSAAVFLVSCLIYFLGFILQINGFIGNLIGITIIGLIFVLKLKDKININIKIKNLV